MKNRNTVREFLIYAVLVGISVITVFPLLWGIASSLRPDEELYKFVMPFSAKTFIPQDLTFNAYIRLFKEFNFQRYILNTFIVTLLRFSSVVPLMELRLFPLRFFSFPEKKLFIRLCF